MNRQRDLFFGKDSRSTPKKDGENPLVPDRRFRAPPPQSFEIRFTNRTVTQFGGYPLWHRFCHAVGLNQRFARHVRMNRGPLAFTAPELARFLTDAKVLGAERPIARRDPAARPGSLPELGAREPSLRQDSWRLSRAASRRPHPGDRQPDGRSDSSAREQASTHARIGSPTLTMVGLAPENAPRLRRIA